VIETEREREREREREKGSCKRLRFGSVEAEKVRERRM